MGHKSKADRQREARDRKLASVLPYNLAEVHKALRFLRQHPHGQWEAEHLLRCANKLLRVQRECDIDQAHAEGVVRSVLAGGDGNSWLSGPEIATVVQRIIDRARQRQGAPAEAGVEGDL